jgi:redox-sensitive bicupin YhaK (pirin superfamily)
MVVMAEQVQTTSRDAAFVEDAAVIQMMGMPVLEAVPSVGAPYELTDPFILVHEGRFRLSEMAGKHTRHPHRGFDNIWYVLKGSASTGHTTGPGGSVERARLSEGSLLWLRTGRGAWHAEAIGADERDEGLGDTEFRSVLFWVNLARKDKQVDPTALVLHKDHIPVRQDGDATVRTLVGDGSPVQLGTPALILDVELASGGAFTTPVPHEFQGFAYLLEGEASVGGNHLSARPPQLVLLGPGEELTAIAGDAGTRFMLFAGKPYRELPRFNGPFVD